MCTAARRAPGSMERSTPNGSPGDRSVIPVTSNPRGVEHDGQRRRGVAHGFTLLELMIVILLISILVALAALRYDQTLVRAREAALHSNLAVMRKAIQDYTLDKEVGPTSLDDLVGAHYISEVPTDPTTGKKDWTTDPCDELVGPDQMMGGICDVHSSSDRVSQFENKPYSAF